MEQLFSAGKAYLKINSLVKTALHEFMPDEHSGLWAPVLAHSFLVFVSFAAALAGVTQCSPPSRVDVYLKPCPH